MSNFRVTPLPALPAHVLRKEVEEGDYPARRVLAGHPAPCRQCLGDAQIGEELLLLSYQPFVGAGPYTSPSPVFLHRKDCGDYTAFHEVLTVPSAPWKGTANEAVRDLLRRPDARGLERDRGSCVGSDP